MQDLVAILDTTIAAEARQRGYTMTRLDPEESRNLKISSRLEDQAQLCSARDSKEYREIQESLQSKNSITSSAQILDWTPSKYRRRNASTQSTRV